MTPDEAAVQAANQAFYRAFESLAFERMEAAWSREEPVSCIHPGWPLSAGREEVLDGWRTIFANTDEIRFTVDGERVEVRGELAWVVCTERLRSRSAVGESRGAVLATNVFRREGGAWRIAHHHASPFIAREPEPSLPPTGGTVN